MIVCGFGGGGGGVVLVRSVVFFFFFGGCGGGWGGGGGGGVGVFEAGSHLRLTDILLPLPPNLGVMHSRLPT